MEGGICAPSVQIFGVFPIEKELNSDLCVEIEWRPLRLHNDDTMTIQLIMIIVG